MMLLAYLSASKDLSDPAWQSVHQRSYRTELNLTDLTQSHREVLEV
jgi:hypothetical protein